MRRSDRPICPQDGADVAHRHSLTVYDASYLELAEGQVAPLATLDVTLARAARRENISLIGQKTA
jgi:predicted nucleic acid-binding protein